MIVEVSLNLPLRQSFDYSWPDSLSSSPQIGLRVLVPFRTRKKSGVVTQIKSASPFKKLKNVEGLWDEDVIFPKRFFH